MTYAEVYQALRPNYKDHDLKLFERAYQFAESAHEGQMRKSGEPYITHPLAVAHYLGSRLRMDISTLAAGLLHDVPEETPKTLDDIKKEFGVQIAFLVSGITKLGKIKLRNQHDETYIETLRKMFLTMAADIRVVLIKLADRQDNLATLQYLPAEKRERIARETLEVYAPIADRLGMGELKGELEDLSFPFVFPTDYQWLKEQGESLYEKAREYVERAKNRIQKTLV